MRTIPLLALPLLVSTAAADPAEAPASTGDPGYAMGVRVGGYGFRREGAMNQAGGWNECRMNGVGVFADRTLTGPLFVEAGLDTYFTVSQPAGDLPIDRASALLSVAGGARTQLTSWLRGYVQLGAGVELTRVSVPYGDADTIREDKVLPEGFFGFGGDIKLGDKTSIGTNVRVHVMGNFEYDPTKLQMTNQWVAPPPASSVFDASPGLAAQAQFYFRRAL
jgi:hypothetical protein